MRLVEVFDSRSLFNDGMPREQAHWAMNAAVEADEELMEVAGRLQAGPEEFLTLRLLSPAEELLLRQESKAGDGDGSPRGKFREGLKRLAADVFGKDARPAGVEEDLKILRVQEFLTQRKALGR